MSARIIEVIETWDRRGKGIDDDPVRRVYQLWSKEGKLLHEDFDEFKKDITKMEITSIKKE